MIDIETLRELIKDHINQSWHRDIDQLCDFAKQGKQNWEASWAANPDRMGGQFTEEERDRSARGGEGW